MRHPLYPNLNMMEPKFTPERGALAIRLLKEGKSFSAVGRAVGVHRDTIKNWGKRYSPELGKAVTESKQRKSRAKATCEALQYLDQHPIKENKAREEKADIKNQGSGDWAKYFKDLEEKRMSLWERDSETNEKVEGSDMIGFWVG